MELWDVKPPSAVSESVLARIILFASIAVAGATLPVCRAADVWGGSLDLTSDYLVRGVSRSDDHAAIQGDVHYLSAAGFVAGLFASSARIAQHVGTGLELDGFAGFTWNAGGDWHGKLLLDHYAYVWDGHGVAYDYDEINVDVSYQDWLGLGLVYSPDFPRIVRYHGITRNPSESADLNLQAPPLKGLVAAAGVGYSHLDGPDSAGYVYWSIGLNYHLAPVYLALTVIGTSGAKTSFYDEAAHNRLVGTLSWQF
jgi:uncharacterized protein (TIGR02001 family)